MAACLDKEPDARPDFDELITLLFKEEGPITRKRSFPFAKAGASIIGASLFLTIISLCTIRDAESDSESGSMVMKSSPARITQVAPLRAMLEDRLPEDIIPEKSPTPLPDQPSTPDQDSTPQIKPVAELPKLSAEVIMNEAVKPASPSKKENLFASLLKLRSSTPEPEIKLAVTEVDKFPATIPGNSAEEPEVAPKPEPAKAIDKDPKPLIERGKSFLIEDIDLKMIWIEPLEMWVARTEVTQKQFNQSGAKERSRYDGADLACDSVSWNEAMDFCRWLNQSQRQKGILPTGWTYTLPTEKQWQLYVGNADLSQAVHGKDRSSGPSQPGTLPANEYGLVDVRGNLWEWTTTDFSSNPAKGKALLGGSFVSSEFMVMNPDARFYGALDNTYFQYGFRVILTANSAQNQE